MKKKREALTKQPSKLLLLLIVSSWGLTGKKFRKVDPDQ
jgi:hypothetical protein